MRNAIRNFGALMPAVALLATVMLLPAPARAAGESGDSEIPGPLKTAITYKLQDRIKEAVGQKNAQGKRFKRGAYSSRFEKVDDTTYAATVQIDTAFETSMQTERIRMILDVEGSAKVSVREELIEDTYTALYRSRGYSCYPFSSFAFDREGMKMSSGPGHVCEFYFNEEVNQVGIASDSLMYEYTLPEHLELIQPAHQYHTLKEILEGDHGVELVFDPEFLAFQCDGETCDEILTSSFKGLERIAAEARSSSVKTEPASMNSAMKRRVDKFNKDWNERFNDNPFHGFRRLDRDSHHFYNALAFRNDDDGVGIAYDNLDGYEVQFFVITGDQIDAAAIRGSIFGYYTEETLKNTSAYDLEQRDDIANREYEIYSVKGEVDAGIDDPEWVKAKIEFGVTVKDDLRELQFFIANAPRGDDTNFRRPSLQVNAVQMDGKDMTWIKTGAFGGLVIFPETVKAGETVYLTMDFATRAIRKYNVAFSQLARFGWMPFVRFGDFIEEFELTIRTPSQYKILGIGQKMEESVSGGVRTSHWSAESPVVFPSIIFGKYFSDDTGDKYKASKIDGTTVPVNVHVDEVSLTDWDIRTKQLRPIATQAAVSIDIYKDISGVDYPYGELNLVNDPSPALYGQAPSSLIYLGSPVFRGEGMLAARGGGTGTTKFVKSVTAHEVGHQWWGSSVSNKNDRSYWFVETLAEYFSAIYLERVYGQKAYDQQVAEWRTTVLDSRVKASVQEATPMWPGEDGFGSYQSALYSKGPMVFHMLRETFGDEKFFPALKQFSLELAEKREIVTRDIQLAAEKAFGGLDPQGNAYNVDLEWFFDQWIRGVGIPQFALNYDVRQAEDGEWLIEGTVKQRIVIGSQREMDVVEGAHYRGVVDLVVEARKGEKYGSRIILNSPEESFRLKVKEKPLEIVLNESDGMLAHDVLVNRDF